MSQEKNHSALERAITEFLTYLELAKNRSRLTIKNYRFYLTRFAETMKVNRPERIDRQTIKQYRLLLNRWEDKHGKPLSKATQNYHMIALRAFLKYLAKEDHQVLAPEAVELMKMPDRQIDFLEADDLDALLAQPHKTDNTSIIRLRDSAILETLFSTGLRVSELVNLRSNQVNTKKEELSVRGKGGKIRVVFLSSAARQAIQSYRERRKDNAPQLFIRHDRARKQTIDEDGKPLTARSVERMIHRYAQLAGITKHITPHTMRHTYATDLLRNGADLRSVQALLGHASIATTQVYTHVTDQQLREVHQAFHARRRKRE